MEIIGRANILPLKARKHNLAINNRAGIVQSWYEAVVRNEAHNESNMEYKLPMSCAYVGDKNTQFNNPITRKPPPSNKNVEHDVDVLPRMSQIDGRSIKFDFQSQSNQVEEDK